MNVELERHCKHYSLANAQLSFLISKRLSCPFYVHTGITSSDTSDLYSQKTIDSPWLKN